MKKVFKVIFGKHFISSAAGYIVAGLQAYQAATQDGVTTIADIGIMVGIAVLGRVAADSDKVKELP
jgi:hypothetical protein